MSRAAHITILDDVHDGDTIRIALTGRDTTYEFDTLVDGVAGDNWPVSMPAPLNGDKYTAFNQLINEIRFVQSEWADVTYDAETFTVIVTPKPGVYWIALSDSDSSNTRITTAFEDSTSTPYMDVVSRLVYLLGTQQTALLANGFTGSVDVRAGRYIPQPGEDVPVIYIMPEAPALISELAGGRVRREQLTLLFTGGVRRTTQADALTDVCRLMNNLQNVLMFFGADSTNGTWYGSRFGMQPGDDDSPEIFGKFDIEAGQDTVVAHFAMRWSCSINIRRESELAS